jgi:hypothetical protein
MVYTSDLNSLAFSGLRVRVPSLVRKGPVSNLETGPLLFRAYWMEVGLVGPVRSLLSSAYLLIRLLFMQVSWAVHRH